MENVYEKLSISQVVRFRAIVREIEKLGNPAKDMQEVAQRLRTDERLAIANVSDFLKTIQGKLRSPALIEATPGRGNIRVTAAGKKLNEFAVQIEAALRASADPASRERLTLACGALFAAQILPQLLRKYLRNGSYFREIWITERIGPDEVLQRVQDGSVDLGITLHWPAHGLHSTPLIQASRGIVAHEDYLPETRSALDQAAMAKAVVVTYEPRILRDTGMERVFPAPERPGVRVYVRGENTVMGWVQHAAGLGHSYRQPVKLPPRVRFVGDNLTTGFLPSHWFVYTRNDPLSASDEREAQVAVVIQAMKDAAVTLDSSAADGAAPGDPPRTRRARGGR